MQLSQHFSLAEFTASQTAARRGIDNTPSEREIEALRELCEHVLEPVRALLGPTIVSSGYRCLNLNRAIGSHDGSQHVLGQAADIHFAYVLPLDAAEKIAATDIPFDQLIHEFGAWVHISYGPRKRRELLTIDQRGTRSGLLPIRH